MPPPANSSSLPGSGIMSGPPSSALTKGVPICTQQNFIVTMAPTPVLLPGNPVPIPSGSITVAYMIIATQMKVFSRLTPVLLSTNYSFSSIPMPVCGKYMAAPGISTDKSSCNNPATSVFVSSIPACQLMPV